MSAADLISLAERVEKAGGPDKYIDRAVCETVFDDSPILTPDYTASLDSARTLVPEGCVWSLGSAAHEFVGVVGGMVTFGATPALALTAAALRARAAQEQSA